MVSSDFGAFRTTEETRYRPPTARFEPRYRTDDRIRRDLLAIERADRELRQHETDGATARRILRDALARNTFGTVSIEGNPLSLDRVRSLLQAALSPATAVEPDERDVLNLGAFLAALHEHDPPRTPGDLERLHATLFRGTVPRPGRFKDRVNFIGRKADRTVVYVPTPPERVSRELASALEWFHAADEHPLVRIALFFHELQSIHPFADGNGRLGRAVSALQLHHAGYPTARYATVDYAINQDRDAYYDALTETQGGEWDLTAWVRYFVGVLREAYDDALRRFLFRDALPPGLDDRPVQVAAWIARRDRASPGRRLMVNDVQAAFPQTPRRTLQRDLHHLVDQGVLERTGHGRGASYGLHPRFRRTMA